MYAELMRTKVCSDCGLHKPLTEFYKRTLSPDGLGYKCKPCDLKTSQLYVANNKEKVRLRRREYRNANKERISIKKNRAKCSLEEFSKLFIEQKGRCKICNTHQDELKRRIAIDHCHETGKIRGLLCDRCNRAIGLLKDSIELLNNAANYLSNHKK